MLNNKLWWNLNWNAFKIDAKCRPFCFGPDVWSPPCWTKSWHWNMPHNTISYSAKRKRVILNYLIIISTTPPNSADRISKTSKVNIKLGSMYFFGSVKYMPVCVMWRMIPIVPKVQVTIKCDLVSIDFSMAWWWTRYYLNHWWPHFTMSYGIIIGHNELTLPAWVKS